MTAPLEPAPATLVRAVAAVSLVAALAAGAGIPVRASYGARTSGDEPHYLLTALSLAEDASLDVSDEHDAGRYRPFHEPGLRSQATREVDGGMVVPHDPLLPVLLAAPMAAGGWIAAKATLAGMAGALAGLLVWVMVRRFAVPLRAAALTTVLLSASAPFAVYGNQVYPELPAALAVTVAIAALTRLAGPGAVTVLGLAVVTLPWLSVKYVPVAATLAVLALVRLHRGGAGRAAGWLVGGLAGAGVVYVLAHLAWYGGVTVYAAGRFFVEQGGQLSVVGTDPDYLGRASRLLGLLVGRWFGLAAWQPAWLLVVPAAAALLRRRPAGWDALASPFVAGWLSATFLAATMQGYWFPGRQLVVVLPAAAVALAWWTGRSGRRLVVMAAAGVLGIAGYGFLLVEGWRGDLTWVVDFHTTGYPWYRAWRMALPDYLGVTTRTWALHGAWLVALVALAAWGWRAAGRARAADALSRDRCPATPRATSPRAR